MSQLFAGKKGQEKFLKSVSGRKSVPGPARKMGPKRQLDPDANLATILIANSAAQALPICQILEELLKENVESDSSKIKGTTFSA